ncbi:lysocardiolipin acyltransferase 1 isoform X4 [Loxodonta africana]|uniref:lysocardiolipin acyltransferase 1 isoform X4 n=1 Tax=Loxodonta africana TaxID=9785 RepID=UPI0030D445AF
MESPACHWTYRSWTCQLPQLIMVSWKGIYFILSLFWGSFFGSIFMLGPFLPLMFLNPSWYRWINNRLVATWLTLPVFRRLEVQTQDASSKGRLSLSVLALEALLETMFGVKVIITGDAFIPGERSVIIMNHRTRMDWMFLWNCLMRYSYLRLEKICLKASLKSIPGFGWAMQAAAYVFIHRKWKDDKNHFEDMINYFCHIREPLQLLIFPEGTDLTENSKARSNDFAEQNGLQKYEYVLHPRTTGFTFVVDRLREENLQWQRSSNSRVPAAAEAGDQQETNPQSKRAECLCAGGLLAECGASGQLSVKLGLPTHRATELRVCVQDASWRSGVPLGTYQWSHRALEHLSQKCGWGHEARVAERPRNQETEGEETRNIRS